MHKALIFTDFDAVSDELLDRMIELLPAYRKEKALRCRNLVQRKASAIAYFLLVYGLIDMNITDTPEFTYGKNGKPYLKNNPEVFFNISHCNEGCICVLSDSEVGCDIQEIRPYSNDIALRVCCEEELNALALSDDKATLFTEMWTKKESYIKKFGTGINDDNILINTEIISDSVVSFGLKKCCVSIFY